MIRCGNCGYEGIFETKKCPRCGKAMTLDEGGMTRLRREVEAARAAGEYEMLAESYRTLALAGDLEGEREYARMLEEGKFVVRDMDLAMEYFSRAARKCDALSAYRYSRLISRINDELSRFWLLFSAALGYADAYMGAADEYARVGLDLHANYYYCKAAAAGESDARVRLASRYFYGDGIECSPAYAKYYMEAFTFPPLHAIKLAYKLRQVKSEEAPEIKLDIRTLLSDLIGRARRLDIPEAELHLYKMLAEGGTDDDVCSLASVYLEGRITRKSPEEAVRILTRAAAGGSVKAYITLGLLFRGGTEVKADLDYALECFEHAAKLGSAEAYEYIADIYHSKAYKGRDVAYAYELYMKAYEGGVLTAKKKADDIEAAREGYYYNATRIEDESPREAFRSYAIATVMGHIPAMLKLAECYALGIGTQKDKKEAFSWYKKSHGAGLEEANLPLGVCYGRGVGTAFNYRLATEHLKRALALGDERARGELTRLYENKKRRIVGHHYSTGMRLIYMGRYSAARAYLEVASRLKHPKATYALGTLYEFGRGCEADRHRAYELYTEAQGLGFTDTRSAFKSKILRMLKKM